MTAALSKRSQKKKKNVLDHSCNKHRSVYSKGRKCPGSEKTALNKQREELVSQNQNCDLSIYCSDNLEQFWSLKLCMLGEIDVLIQMV